MSKNISIAEGGVARQFTVDEVDAPKVGGGMQPFVPKDEVRLTTKHISKNGTYPASADGYYGYKAVTVNVSGGTGSSNNSGKPSGTDVTHTKPSGGLDLDGITPPGGAGSAVVGTDPETGNEVAVGVDEEGNIVKTPVPSAIHIIMPPTKTEYVYQEDMDYSGLVVVLKKKDGTTFTDARYMNGHIPMGELIFPVEKAPAGHGSADTPGNLEHPIITAEFPLVIFKPDGIISRWELESGSAVGFRNTAWHKFAVSTEPFSFRSTNWKNGVKIDDFGVFSGIPREINGETIYIYESTVYPGDGVSGNWTVVEGEPNDSDFYSIFYTGGTATIPVKWRSPYTGDELRDTFEITSTGSGGSSSTTTGSTGTEGSGGGGTF